MNTTQSFILRCKLGTAFAGVLWSCTFSLKAQEALQSAVAGDRSYEARQAPDYQPRDERMRIGPVNLALSAAYGLTWNDNVRLAPTNEDADLIHEPGVNLRAVWPATRDSIFSIGVGVGYRKYTDNSELDTLNITPDSELAWDIPIQDWVITLHDRISYSQDVVNEGGLSGTAQFPRLENTVGVRAQWLPGQYFFEMGYEHYNFVSDTSGFDYLSRSSEQFYGRVGYRFAPITRVGLEASGSLTDYDDPTRGDNQSLSIGPFADWQLTRSLRFTVRGGYVIYFLEPAAAAPATTGDLSSYYFGGSAQHQLTDFISHSVSVDRSVQQGINQGSSVSERLNLNYSISWAFHRSARLSVGPFYEQAKEEQSGVAGLLAEDYERYGASVGLGFSLSSRLSAGVSFRHTTKSSDVAIQNQDYKQNTVALTANYRF